MSWLSFRSTRDTLAQRGKGHQCADTELFVDGARIEHKSVEQAVHHRIDRAGKKLGLHKSMKIHQIMEAEMFDLLTQCRLQRAIAAEMQRPGSSRLGGILGVGVQQHGVTFLRHQPSDANEMSALASIDGPLRR